MKTTKKLDRFVSESNRIEDITRKPTEIEISAHYVLLEKPYLALQDICDFVSAIQPNARLRSESGMNVTVGKNFPKPGGVAVSYALTEILERINEGADPYLTHIEYETLHPFTDGNGRSGRAIWLWMMLKSGDKKALDYGFLRLFYYQTFHHYQHNG